MARVSHPGEDLDSTLVAELFATSDAADQANVREMVAALRSDVAARLDALQQGGAALPVEAALRELHQLRGAVGGFGLKGAWTQLTALEKAWAGLALPARADAVVAVRAAFERGLGALRAQLTFL